MYIIMLENIFQFNCFHKLEELDIHNKHLICYTDQQKRSAHSLLCSIPQIKRLTIRECPQNSFLGDHLFDTQMQEKLKAGETLQKLEELALSLDDSYSMELIKFFEPLEVVCKALASLTKVTIENISEDNNIKILKFVNTMRSLQVNVVFIPILDLKIRKFVIINFTEADYGKVVLCKISDNYWDPFWKFWKNTVHLRLTCDGKGWESIDNRWPSKYLPSMVYLRKLELKISDKSCFLAVNGNHKVGVNRSLQVLDVESDVEPCHQCIEVLDRSFPSLKKFIHHFPQTASFGELFKRVKLFRYSDMHCKLK